MAIQYSYRKKQLTFLHRARSCVKAAQLKARETAFTSAGKHEPDPSGNYIKNFTRKLR